ncbi:hypothetical protein D3C73_558420 [compost metagenome]
MPSRTSVLYRAKILYGSYFNKSHQLFINFVIPKINSFVRVFATKYFLPCVTISRNFNLKGFFTLVTLIPHNIYMVYFFRLTQIVCYPLSFTGGSPSGVQIKVIATFCIGFNRSNASILSTKCYSFDFVFPTKLLPQPFWVFIYSNDNVLNKFIPLHICTQ